MAHHNLDRITLFGSPLCHCWGMAAALRWSCLKEQITEHITLSTYDSLLTTLLPRWELRNGPACHLGELLQGPSGRKRHDVLHSNSTYAAIPTLGPLRLPLDRLRDPPSSPGFALLPVT